MFTSYNFPKLENCIDKQLSQIGNISLVGDRALRAFLARAPISRPHRRRKQLEHALSPGLPAAAPQPLRPIWEPGPVATYGHRHAYLTNLPDFSASSAIMPQPS